MQEWKKFFKKELWSNPYWIALILGSLLSLISMATMTIGFGILSLGGMIALFSQDTRTQVFKFRPIKVYLFLSFLLALYLIFTVARQIYFPYEIFGVIPDARWADVVKLIYLLEPLFIVSICTRLNRQKLFMVIHFHWFLLGLLGIVGIIQYYSGWPRSVFLATSVNPRYAAVLFMGLSLSVASVLILAVFPLFSRTLTVLKSNQKFNRTFYFLGISILVFLCIILTFSRIAIVSLPLGIALLIILQGKINKLRVFFTTTILLLGLYLVPPIHQRLHYSLGYSDRIAIWRGHLELIKKFPLLGVGWRQNSKVLDGAVAVSYQKSAEKIPESYFETHAHNNILEILSGAGIVGFAFFCWFNVWLIFFFYQGCKKNNEDAWWFNGMLAGFLLFHLNGLTQANYWDSKVFLQLMWVLGLSFALTLNKESKRL